MKKKHPTIAQLAVLAVACLGQANAQQKDIQKDEHDIENLSDAIWRLHSNALY